MILVIAIGILLLNYNQSWSIFGVADLVHDPISNATNTLTAIRSLASNVHEVTIINGQIRQLASDAANLAKLPLSLMSEIQQTMTAYTSLLNQSRAIAYQATASLARFQELFARGDIPFSQRASAIFQEISNTSQLAISVQSIYDQLCATTARVEQLTNASQAAIGQMQVQQSGNQLLAVLAQQQNGMHELQANTARLQTLVYMQQVVEEEAAQKAAAHWIEGWPTTLGTVEGFKLP
jgi:P-type conjugative transfer protein TrbJ